MSATPAIHVLRQHGGRFAEHEYRYQERGGAAESSRELGVDEHVIVKTGLASLILPKFWSRRCFFKSRPAL